MANYAHVKDRIAANVYTNHDGLVTAENVKTAINEVVDTLIAGGYLYAGVAKLTPTQTNPGSPDANVFYIATEPGTYTNFVGAGGSLVVADGEVAIFKFNGTWSKEVTGAATAAQLNQLGQEVYNFALKQGYTTSIGSISSNPTRVTTGVIPTNGKNIRISYNNQFCYANIIYGDSPSSLSNSINTAIKYGEPYIFTEDADYIAINLVAPGAIITPNDVNVIVSPINAVVGKLDDEERSLADAVSVETLTHENSADFFKFVQGSRGTAGDMSGASDKFISSIVFRYEGDYVITCGNDYRVILDYKADGAGSFTEIGRNTYHRLTGKGYAFVKVSKSDNSSGITPSTDTGVAIAPYKDEQLNTIASIQLKQGYTNTGGSINSHTDRLTTGVLKNDYGKLYVRCNQNYNIQVLSGDASNSLTDGGYISYNGVTAIVDINKKFIAFNIASVTAIEPTSDVGLVILPYNSSVKSTDEDVVSERNDLDIIDSLSGGKQSMFPFTQGERNANGAMHNSLTAAITSRVFRIDGTYRVTCDSSYKFRIYYKADGQTTFTYIAYGVTSYVFTGKGYIYIQVYKQDGGNLTPSESTGIKIENYQSENAPELPFKWTLVGNGTNNLLRFNSHYILRKNVKYSISFSSDNFVLSTGATTAFSIYAMSVDSNAVERPRINLFSPSSLPVTVYERMFNYDVILFGICNLADGSYVEVNITPDISTAEILNINAEKISETKLFRKCLVSDMMTKGNVVSDIIYKTAITDGFDVKKETGDLCVGYCGTTSYSEVGAQPWNAELSICNLADIEGTKQRVKVLEVGQTYNGIFVGQNQHVFAAWTGDDEIALVSQIGGGQDGVVARRYKPSTQEFIGDVVYCDVDVLGTVYSMRKGTDYVDKFNAIWNATGMEHPLGRNGAEYNFFIAGCPVKIGNYFYASWVCGNYAHPLFKSQDLIHWIYVCDIPHSDDYVYDPVTGESTGTWSPSEEVSICYYRNRMYAVTRGNSMPKSQAPEGYPVPETGSTVDCWNTMLYCDFDKLEDRNKNDWATPIVFTHYSRERCTICGISGKLFVLMGTQPFAGLPVDGMNIVRGRHALMIFDTNLNLIRGTILEADTTYLHPIFIDYGGIILSVLSSDLRQFGPLFGGDNRAEIMITRLDPELLYMISERPEI